MKFAKPFLGVPDGEIYPVQYQPGDECPPELEASAMTLEAIEDPEPPSTPAAAPAGGRAKK